MNMYDSIFTRCSTRNFNLSPLLDETIKKIEEFIKSVKPLLPTSNYTYKIISGSEAKGLAVPKAPHFLLISGKEQPLKQVGAGFFGQQVELYMYSLGLATRWLMGVRGKVQDDEHIIGLAFGKPNTPTLRKPEDFNRKPLAEISQGVDSRIDSARYAPSGINGQPWYFIAQNDKIYVYYRRKLSGAIGLLYKGTDLDVGISLAHILVASEHEGKDFNFVVETEDIPQSPKEYEYLGTIKDMQKRLKEEENQ